MPTGEQDGPPPTRGLGWVLQQSGRLTVAQFAQLLADSGLEVSRATLGRMAGGGHDAVSAANVVAVRKGLEVLRRRNGTHSVPLGASSTVHYCLLARGWERHFYWEERRWKEWVAGQDDWGRRGEAARVHRERQGLERAQVAQLVRERFGEGMDHRTVARLEQGKRTNPASVERIALVLGRSYDMVAPRGKGFSTVDLFGEDSDG